MVKYHKTLKNKLNNIEEDILLYTDERDLYLNEKFPIIDDTGQEIYAQIYNADFLEVSSFKYFKDQERVLAKTGIWQENLIHGSYLKTINSVYGENYPSLKNITQNLSTLSSIRTTSGKIIVVGNFTNFNGISTLCKMVSSEDNGVTWVSVGNYTTNNSIRFIKEYDNIIYIGGDFTTFNGISCPSKLAKSTDGGNTWASVSSKSITGTIYDFIALTNQHYIVVGDITNADNSPNLCKFIRSIDGGSTWITDGQIIDTTNSSVLSIDATQSNDIYIAGWFTIFKNISCPSRVAKSTDGGNTWTACGSGSTDNQVEIIKIINGIIYVGGDFTIFNGISCPSRVAKSTDGGNTWIACGSGSTNGVIYSIDSLSNGTLIVGGSFTTFNGISCPSRVTKSTDGGNTWTACGSGSTDNVVKCIRVVNDMIFVTGWFAIFNGITSRLKLLVSIDSGNTWATFGFGEITNAGVNSMLVVPGNPSTTRTYYMVGGFTSFHGISCPSRVAKSTDGYTWYSCGQGTTNGTIYTVNIDSNGIIYVGGDFTIFNGISCPSRVAKSTDGGNTWTACGSGSTDGYIYNIKNDFNGNLFLGGDFTVFNSIQSNLKLIKSSNNGDSWISLSTPVQDTNSTINSVIKTNSNKLIVAGNFTKFKGMDCPSRMMYSLDSGITWSPLGTGTTSGQINKLCYINNKIYALGSLYFSLFNGVPISSKSVVESTDDGNTWNQFQSMASSPARLVYFDNSRIFIIAESSAFSTSGIVYSDDGINWIPINISIGTSYGIISLGNNKYFTNGTLRSSIFEINPNIDMSKYLNSNIVDSNITAIKHHPIFDNIIYLAASTFNGITSPAKLFKSIDGGHSWSSFGNGNTNSTINSIEIDGHDIIYIGGNFTTFNGISCPSRVVKSTDGGNTWGACGSGTTDNLVEKLKIINGILYATGNFTTFNGISCPSRVAKSTDGGNTWTACGSGLTNGVVKGIEALSNGTLIVAGYFTIFNDQSCISRMAQSLDNGLSWSMFGSGQTNNNIMGIKKLIDNNLYFFGSFTTFNGSTCSLKVARYLISSNTWQILNISISSTLISDVSLTKLNILVMTGTLSSSQIIRYVNLNTMLQDTSLSIPVSSSLSSKIEVCIVNKGFY